VLKDTGSEFVGDKPENFAAFVRAEAAKWGKIAKETGATVDERGGSTGAAAVHAALTP
jgi:hypothetical protein